MIVDTEKLVDDVAGSQYSAQQLGLPERLDFNIPNTCLDVTTSSRPGLRDPSINISGCSASIGGKACTCNPCGGGSGIEIGADCVSELFTRMIPSSLSNNNNTDISDAFTIDVTDPICIGGQNLFTGRGVVDIMLTPYLSQL